MPQARRRARTEEEKQIADAPEISAVNTPETTVETTETPVSTTEGSSSDNSAETAVLTNDEPDLNARVQALFNEQFDGEDGAPAEGVEPWNDLIREQVLQADQLEVQYRTVLEQKEANRSLLRNFATMGKVPKDVADYYYPPRAPKGSRRGGN